LPINFNVTDIFKRLKGMGHYNKKHYNLPHVSAQYWDIFRKNVVKKTYRTHTLCPLKMQLVLYTQVQL